MDEDICAITKSYNDSTIIVLYNISEETKEVTISKEDYDYSDIRGYLTVDETPVSLEEDKVIMPAYSIVILN